MSFADNVKKARIGLGLTQETLGKLVGVSGQAVSKWETEDGFPDPSLLPALADALEHSPDHSPLQHQEKVYKAKEIQDHLTGYIDDLEQVN